VFAAAAGQGSDFTISLQHDGFNHEELPVHKLVLAMRSPVLRGMLHSDMAEARAGRIVIRDVIPPAANAVVHFLYTDRLPAGEHRLPQCAAAWHIAQQSRCSTNTVVSCKRSSAADEFARRPGWQAIVIADVTR
jgi:hypothetical protein